jgi:signal transduction histidine kinase/DNA-binding response OmpR family regulator
MAKILAVDDEELNLLLLKEYLEEYDVISAIDGYKLLEKIETEKPDLVILDIKMKKYNGLDLLQDIRKKFYNMPVILNSAYTGFRHDLKALAADYYVVKSSDLAELKRKIRVCVLRNNREAGVVIDNINKLVRKRRCFITKKDYDSLYRQAIQIPTIIATVDIEAILDDEIESHNKSQKVIASYLKMLRNAYRDMVIRGKVSLISSPNKDTVEKIFAEQPDLNPPFPILRNRVLTESELLNSLTTEYDELSGEVVTLETELHSVLRAVNQRKLSQIRNYERLKHVLTSKTEEDYSPLLLGEDFGIILEDFNHDIKNSIRAINDLVGDAEEKVDESFEGASRTRLTEIFSTIEQRTRAIGELVKEMEQIPFIRSVIPEPVILKARIEEIIIDLKISSNIKWEVLTDPSELFLATDTRMFSIIIKNVVKNAMEAMPQGGHLKVTAVEATKMGKIDIDISDTGVGIPAKFIQKVFDLKFSRGKEKGRGMGLYIAKKATVALGGIIFIDSVENKGTTVHIRLPRGG